MDVSTQRSLQMTMHQWAKYFESDNRDTLLNVISLEVSNTKLGDIVQPPTFVCSEGITCYHNLFIFMYKLLSMCVAKRLEHYFRADQDVT